MIDVWSMLVFSIVALLVAAFIGVCSQLQRKKVEARMLVLMRKKNEAIRIGDDITVTVVKVHGDKVRLGIDAPEDVKVHRQEVYESIQRQIEQEAIKAKSPEELMAAAGL